MNMNKKLLSLIYCLIGSFLILGTIHFNALAAEGPVSRGQIEEKYQWNLGDIYSNQKEWEIDFAKIQNEYLPKMEEFRDKLSQAENVLACLQFNDELFRLIEKLYVYAYMKADENQDDSVASEMSSRAETLYSQAAATVSFIRPELLSQPESVLKGYMEDPAFSDYRHTLDALLKLKPHTLSKPEEELLAKASDMASAPSVIFDKVTEADMIFPKVLDDKGKEVQLSEGVFYRYLQSPDREFRKRVYEGILNSYDKSKNTLAATLNSEVKKNWFYSQARKYDSSLEASLFSENIPREVYDNLIQAVNNNLSYLHQYVQLRKKVFQLDQVQIFDMYVPLVADYTLTVSYEKAQQKLLEGLKPLGPEYLDMLKKGFENRWIDVYETENKATGGYSWGAYDTHPYILMNYDNTADSMLTLAHEMGHALNSHYTNSSQKYVNSQTPIFTAEVASTMNENLMLEYLIKNAKNDDEKLYFLDKLIENIRGTVYTQVMYSEFEQIIHERIEKGEALSYKYLSDAWKELLGKYYGPDFIVEELASRGWSRIPHFYMNFYVFKYATSLAASNELLNNILTDQPDAIDKYLSFLKAGSSDYPVEILKAAGVDMISTQPVDHLLKKFGDLVKDMEETFKKKGIIE
ncbi:Oligoendopeptidase F, plasmid [Atribacter laminatus]|uniref:Oligopeptidase F n=2 Tax=Atribacter laminatus TaxID=2847778 RepID=A0A7T1AKS5_ATRLM|nr:Oligoendopeptidase F, plasmid [Atribacter laminatus]